MDNHFVPNLTIGLPVVEASLARTELPLDCHLMIENPDRRAPAYAEAGAHSVTFHIEAAGAPVRLARELRRIGSRAGVVLKPATSVDTVGESTREIDLLLVMTVEPGFGGQAFLKMRLLKSGRHVIWCLAPACRRGFRLTAEYRRRRSSVAREQAPMSRRRQRRVRCPLPRAPSASCAISAADTPG